MWRPRCGVGMGRAGRAGRGAGGVHGATRGTHGTLPGLTRVGSVYTQQCDRKRRGAGVHDIPEEGPGFMMFQGGH